MAMGFGRFSNKTVIRILLFVFFLMLYSLLTFHLVGLQQNCLSAREIAIQIKRFEMEEMGILSDILDNSSSTNPLLISGRPHSTERPEVKKETPSFFVNDQLPPSELLDRNHGPNTVYYIWCGQRWFEFPHYLSVMSVIRILRPDSIVFLYDTPPVMDSWSYNTWYKELGENYPFFRGYQLDAKEQACEAYAKPSYAFIQRLLSNQGGMFMNEMTILAKYATKYRSLDIVDAFDPDTGTGFIMTKRGFPGTTDLRKLDSNSQTTKRLHCVEVEQYVKSNRKPSCVYQTGPLFPKDIWELDNSFGRLVREIFYGTPQIVRPVPSYDTLIPNIAHIVWLGGGDMDFLFLLCVLSLLHVAKVEALYIHGDGPPGGKYWDLVKNEQRLHLIYRDYPVKIYGTDVKVWSHITDIWRVDFMVKYGGIYVDTDTVFVRPLTHEIRGYDAVGTYDWTYWNHPFPDTINFGVALGKRNAKYWHEFQESMKWFMDHDWSWNGLRQPYRIQERHPDLVLIDPHLQITCYLSLCHPTWWPDYHNESIHHLNSKSIKNWRADAFAFHWTLPTPYELHNQTTLFSTNSIFSEIGKYVLEQSGFLEYFQNLDKNQRKPTKEGV